MTAANLTTIPGRAMLDTNVFLAATDEGRAEHDQALAIINEWPYQGTTLYASGQIMREYLAVATRPAEKNGLGLALSDALANVRALRKRTSLLAEDDKVADQLLSLLDEAACGGKQVHDANIVATMLVHGIDTIVTMNLDDFTRFAAKINPIGLT
jgi:predicted nucleic acid-binding protein